MSDDGVKGNWHSFVVKENSKETDRKLSLSMVLAASTVRFQSLGPDTTFANGNEMCYHLQYVAYDVANCSGRRSALSFTEDYNW